MKLKALLGALFVAGLIVSVAVAAPAEKSKGKNGTTAAESPSTDGSTAGTTTGSSSGQGKHEGRKNKGKAKHAGCKPRRAVVLRGSFVGAGAGGFAMNVTGANRHGRSLVGKQVTVLVAEGTKIRRHGKATLADLKTGDRLNVQGRVCNLDQQAMTLVAKRVVAHSPSGDDDEDEGEGTTSTSTNGTTTATTTGTTTTTES
jgi:hypothetical protein